MISKEESTKSVKMNIWALHGHTVKMQYLFSSYLHNGMWQTSLLSINDDQVRVHQNCKFYDPMARAWPYESL